MSATLIDFENHRTRRATRALAAHWVDTAILATAWCLLPLTWSAACAYAFGRPVRVRDEAR